MSSQTTRLIAIYFGLAGLVALVFLQTGHFSFVNYDDGSYVFDNPNIRAGLTWRGVVWAFTHVHSQNWHPLTSISHMIDCQLFGLMSKPMLVTTPIVLLLLDYWPFDRFKKQGSWKLILEKVPLAILSVGSCAATLIAQQVAIGSTESLPLASRIDNAFVTYVNYLRQMFWPVDLVPFYIHPEWRLATWEIIGAIILLAGITAAMFLLRRKLPFLLVGWLWYIVMLLPVIGIIQVGLQARADRYTYLPQIGIIIAVVWAIRDLTSLWRARTVALVPASLVVVGSLSFLSYRQATHWRD